MKLSIAMVPHLADFRKEFLPELRGKAHPETAPLQALCCALCSTEQSIFREGGKGEKEPRQGEEEEQPAKGQKGKRTHENRSGTIAAAITTY